MANPLMQAALDYEAKGYSIIPLKPKDKIPLIPSWAEYQVERADREQIGEWWRTWPNANIGIITGAISGLLVVDADSQEAATRIKANLGPMDGVGIAATGKGYHLYYKHAGSTMPNKAAIVPQVDFRGDGGYVVAPPSIHSTGRVYEWAKPINGHLRELPQEFIALLSAPAQVSKAPFDTKAALSGLPEGQRDQGLFKLAAKLRGADVPYEIALELCEQAAANCVPPFRDARRKVDQAYKYSPGHSAKDNPISPQSSLWPEPITIKEFDLRPKPEQRWLWEEALSFASTSQIVGAPRHGKSTFAFNLALAISRGADFLGRKTTKVPVLYVSIDNSEDEIRDIKSKLGCLGEENFYLHIGDVPGDPVPGLLSIVEKYGIKFVVIDTYLRFFRLKELKNEEMASVMGPVAIKAQDMGIHIMYLHHAGKNLDNGALTSGLGGIVGKGMTPWYFELARIPDSQQRILTSDHRAGKAFDKVFLKIDPKTGWSYAAGNAADAYVESCIPKIIEFVKAEPYCSERDIRASIPARGLYVSLALRRLMSEGEIEFDQSGPRHGRRFYVPASFHSMYGTDL